MRREYGPDELAGLKGIYDEGGEAALDRDEMRALRKAGLLARDLPPEPVERAEPAGRTASLPDVRRKVFDTIVGLSKTGGPTLAVIARECGMSRSGVHHHVSELVLEGLVARNPNGSGYIVTADGAVGTNKKGKVDRMCGTDGREATIEEALEGVYEGVSLLQRTAFRCNDKVAYQYAAKLLAGELMDLKANYSREK